MPVIGLIGPEPLRSLMRDGLKADYGFIDCCYGDYGEKDNVDGGIHFTTFDEAESFWLKRPSTEYYVTAVDREDSLALDAFTKRTLFLLINLQFPNDPLDPQVHKHSAFTIIHDVPQEESKERLQVLLKNLALNTPTWYRPDWDTYFMEMTRLAALRSNCCKRRVGCVLVNAHSVIATGYNGTPRTLLNCIDGGCPRCHSDSRCGADLSICLCLHAEENALLEAGRTRALGCTLYCTTAPCVQCTKKIVQCGVRRVVYAQEYAVEHDCKSVLAGAGIELDKYFFRDNVYLLSTQIESKPISRTCID